MTKRQKGFSLIELLIVVAIILIIAAIAIPNLMRSKMAANESSAASMIRTLYTSSVTYSSTYGVGFPTSLAVLGPAGGTATASCTSAGLIDSILANAINGSIGKNGYWFNLIAGSTSTDPNTGCTGGATFSVDAVPVAVGTTGQRSFCSGTDGVIYVDSSGGAQAQASGICAGTQPLNTR